MVVSDAISYKPSLYFVDVAHSGMGAQVEPKRKNIRGRHWVLRHLKSFGLTERELVKMYKAVIRPVAVYCSVVYHSALTEEQDKIIERIQSQALKCIYGPGISAGVFLRYL